MQHTTMSRRQFVTGSSVAVGAAALGAGGVAALADEATSASDGEQGDGQATYSFEVAPDPIPEEDITETREAELIVVGAGYSGLCCALSAVEEGVDTIVIAASDAPVYRGGSNHAAYSKVMEAAGLPRRDAGTFFKKELWRSGYNVNAKLWMKWWNNSEQTMDWMIDLLARHGVDTILEKGNTDPVDGVNEMEPGSHSFVNDEVTVAGAGQGLAVDALAEEILSHDNGQIIYQTTAQQLVREDGGTGRVDAVVATDADGNYVKYVGTKAIVLATGDFSADGEMMEKYCPWAMPIMTGGSDYQLYDWQQFGGLYTGQGQKMGLWVGAAWQKTFPNCAMIMDIQYMDMSGNQAYGSHRGLIVNRRGERFVNEDVNAAELAVMQTHQPGMEMWSIWPDAWADFAQPFYPFTASLDDDPMSPEDVRATWEAAVEAGTMWKADTVEELLAQLDGLDAEGALATIEEYNGYCEAGEDAEFHKDASYLCPLTEGPFYANHSTRPTFFTVLGGLRTNCDMQVCDADDEPIPGLYNVGSMAGDLFAGHYDFMVEGHCYGMCLTLGYLTGKHIAASE